MILSFYDRQFKGLQNNASLVVDNQSYSLIKRGVELDELRCTCEPFTESIQPTFLIVKNDKGNYVYGALAGIPELTNERKTIVVGADLKSMFKSDLLLDFASQTLTTVADVFDYVFGEWNSQVNQSGFSCELEYKGYIIAPPTVTDAADIALTELKHQENGKYDAWEDIFSPYLKYYGLYMTSRIDLINKKVVFTVGRSMLKDLNIKLWEHGIYDYGKKIADVNECQGYVLRTDLGTYSAGYKWLLTSQNAITTNTALRDIYPVKRRVIVKETDDAGKETELLNEANREALETLCGSLYKENITLSVNGDFETNFNIYVRRGGGLYKSLPCGELHYDASGLKQLQIGYRFTGLQFLL